MPEEVLLLPVLLEIRTDTRPEQNCKVRITNVLNRKNGFAEGKIGAKVAVAQSHEEQLL